MNDIVKALSQDAGWLPLKGVRTSLFVGKKLETEIIHFK